MSAHSHPIFIAQLTEQAWSLQSVLWDHESTSVSACKKCRPSEDCNALDQGNLVWRPLICHSFHTWFYSNVWILKRENIFSSIHICGWLLKGKWNFMLTSTFPEFDLIMFGRLVYVVAFRWFRFSTVTDTVLLGNCSGSKNNTVQK